MQNVRYNLAIVFLLGMSVVCLTTALLWERRKDASANEVVDEDELRLVEGDFFQTFDEVPSGVIPKHEFTIVNVSKGAVALSLGRVSCSCADVEIDNPHVVSGETARVVVSLDLAGRTSAREMVELKVRRDHRGSNDTRVTQSALLSLEVKSIDEDMGLRPSVVSFGTVRRSEEPRSTEFELVLPADGNPEVVNVAPPDSIYGITIEMRGKPPLSNGVCTISGLATLDPGKVESSIARIKDAAKIRALVGGTETEFALSLQASVRNEVEATPSIVYWSRNHPAGSIIVEFDASGGEIATIERVRVEGEVAVQWRILDSGTKLSVDAISAEKHQGLCRAVLQADVCYAGGKQKTVDLPVLVN